jgi:hypothetical protein
MDTKKKEYLGDFYRDGHLYTTEELQVYDHDFNRVKSRIPCKKGGMSQATSRCVLRSTAPCVSSGTRPSSRRRSLSC